MRTRRWSAGRTGHLWRRCRRIDPAIAALTIVAFGVAFYRVGAKSLVLDEVVSARHASVGLNGLWHVIRGGDPNMGLYYALLHLWVRMFGHDETALRGLTVILGALAIPVTALLGRELFGRAAGLVAGMLLALSPFFVRYEQTARSYAMVVLLVVLSSYFFLAELDQPSRAKRVGYVLSTSLAVYTHYFAALVLMVQLLTLLAVKRREALGREWVATVAAVAILCAPEAIIAIRAGPAGISWIPEPSLSSLVRFPSQLAGNGAGFLPTALLVLACFGFLRAFADRARWRAGYLAAWCLVPVFLDFAVSQLGQSLFISYYLIVVLPALLLLAGAGLVRLPSLGMRVVVVVVLIVLSVSAISSWYRAPSDEDYRGATRYVVNHARPGDGAIYDPSYILFGFEYYGSRSGTSGLRVAQLASGQIPPARLPGIWLVTRELTPQRQAQAEQSITGEYKSVGMRAAFGKLKVILYRAR